MTIDWCTVFYDIDEIADKHTYTPDIGAKRSTSYGQDEIFKHHARRHHKSQWKRQKSPINPQKIPDPE